MFCFNCGSQIHDSSVFCPECGAKVAAGAAQKELSAEKPTEITKDNFPVSNPPPKPQENPSQKGKGKKKMIIAIVAALVLLIAAGGVFAYFHFNDSPTVGSTNSNLMNGGFVTTKNDTVYYVKFVDSYYKTELKSMDINGGNVKTLYSFDGEIALLNIVGNQIYFDGDTYDENGIVTKSNIFVFNLNDLSVNTVFDPQDIDVASGSAEFVLGDDDAQYIYSTFIKENKIYFGLYKSGVNGIYSMNLDGSDLTTIIQKNSGTMNYFSMADSSLFYQYNDAFYRCDLEGDNTTKLYDRPEAYNGAYFCINDGKFYLYDNCDNDVSKIISMDLDGGDQKEIARFEEEICSINVVGDKIYYTLINYDINAAQICSMNLDGSDQKVLKTSDESDEGYYSGINVYGHWLYYLATDNYGTSSGKIDLNDVTE